MATHLHSSQHRKNTRGKTDTSLTHPPQKPISVRSSDSHSDVRWEKILSLRTAIACGRYNISAEAVATKLMDYMRGEAVLLHRHAQQKAC